MKRLVYFSLSIDPVAERQCLDSLGDVRILRRSEPLPTSGRIHLHVETDSEHWRTIRSIAKDYNINGDMPRGREECAFSKREINDAELLVAIIARSPVLTFDTATHDEYDFSQKPSPDNPAPWCWQVGPLHIKQSRLKTSATKISCTDFGAILVHETFYDSLDAATRQAGVVAALAGNGQSSGWLQLRTARCMPPYHPSTTGVEHVSQPNAPIPLSVFDSYTEGFAPTYDRREVLEHFGGQLPALSFTSELYGDWKKPTGADIPCPPQPRLVVRQSTRQRFAALGAKGLRYIPVQWA